MIELKGLCTISFTNGQDRDVIIKQVVQNFDGEPVWIESTTGNFYNWKNIVSIRPKDG